MKNSGRERGGDEGRERLRGEGRERGGGREGGRGFGGDRKGAREGDRMGVWGAGHGEGSKGERKVSDGVPRKETRFI